MRSTPRPTLAWKWSLQRPTVHRGVLVRSGQYTAQRPWRRYGERQVLGMDVGPSEDRAFWTAFLRSLVKRGLRGVRLVTSDAHEGLKQAIATVLSGATWQRCRVHFMRNLLATVP